jgi:hypothetical protein
VQQIKIDHSPCMSPVVAPTFRGESSGSGANAYFY